MGELSLQGYYPLNLRSHSLLSVEVKVRGYCYPLLPLRVGLGGHVRLRSLDHSSRNKGRSLSKERHCLMSCLGGLFQLLFTRQRGTTTGPFSHFLSLRCCQRQVLPWPHCWVTLRFSSRRPHNWSRRYALQLLKSRVKTLRGEMEHSASSDELLSLL